MNDKDKMVERLSGEEQPKEVLGIHKRGPDYEWLTLILDGRTLNTDFDAITWDVSPGMKKTMAYICKEGKKGAFNNDPPVTIKGPRKKINNLLFNIGIGLVNERRESYWRKSKDKSYEDYIETE